MIVRKKDSEVAATPIVNNRASLLTNASTQHGRSHEYKPHIDLADRKPNEIVVTSSSSSRWTNDGDSSSTTHHSFSVGNDYDQSTATVMILISHLL